MKKGKGGDQASLRLQWIDAIQHDELILNSIFILKTYGNKTKQFQIEISILVQDLEKDEFSLNLKI